jgi:hypothetical protein
MFLLADGSLTAIFAVDNLTTGRHREKPLHHFFSRSSQREENVR